MSDVTRILSQIESGDPQAAEQLLPLVYDELRNLAAARLAHEQPGQTLAGDGADARGGTRNSRCHFFGAAADAMRRILWLRVRLVPLSGDRGKPLDGELRVTCRACS